ncbi:S1-like domain-containing RNA-binding protein [Vibrio sp.]|nr:S1-like domain-containing RNA-binding protein [Vibrio sp.]
MIEIGKVNRLTIVKKADFGVFLDAGEFGNVLLPVRFVPEDAKVEDEIDAFLYFDSENEIVATTETPLAQVGEWAMMTIDGVSSIGAFAGWGIKAKDLLIPFSEQRTRFREGQNVLVYVYRDKASGRIVGTTKFNKLLDKTKPDYQTNEMVDLIIAERSDLGFKAIVNEQHWGMIFPSDVFGKLHIGKKLKGYIKNIREDDKIDLSLQKIGVGKMDDLSLKILETLEKKGGSLPLSDKSSPDEIFAVFRTSKGTFKKTIGGLFKQGKITLSKEGISLVTK